MVDHLTECPLLEPCSADTPNHGFCSRQNTICIHCERQCICDRLRACEQRVLDAAEASVERAHDWYELSEGLEGRAMMKCDALAAIDALREEKPPPLSPSVGVPSKPMWPLREEQK